MLEKTQAQVVQPESPKVISLDKTFFSVDFVSLGVLAGAITWGFKVWLDHDKRITSLENNVEQNNKEIIEGKKTINDNYQIIGKKLESIDELGIELKSLNQEIGYLKKSIDKDFSSRNQIIDETKGRVFSLETDTRKILDSIANLSGVVNNLYTQMASMSPSVFGRRGIDHGNPPSNPQRYD